MKCLIHAFALNLRSAFYGMGAKRQAHVSRATRGL